MSTVLQTYMTYNFLRLLTQPWIETDAFKFGIIDDEGQPLKKYKDLPDDQKDSYSIWHRLVFKLKRILDKIPFGRTIIGSYIAALYLIKENSENKVNFDILLREFCELQGIDPKSLFAESVVTEPLVPGVYIVTSKHLDDLLEGEILCITEERTKPVDNILGVDVYLYGDRPFTQFDIFPYDMMAKLDEEVMGTTGVAGVGSGEEPPGPASKPIRRGKFAGMTVFECDLDTFNKCRHGKSRYHRYDKYVGTDDFGQAVREYGLKNPSAPIILRHEQSGHMMYLKHPKK